MKVVVVVNAKAFIYRSVSMTYEVMFMPTRQCVFQTVGLLFISDMDFNAFPLRISKMSIFLITLVFFLQANVAEYKAKGSLGILVPDQKLNDMTSQQINTLLKKYPIGQFMKKIRW